MRSPRPDVGGMRTPCPRSGLRFNWGASSYKEFYYNHRRGFHLHLLNKGITLWRLAVLSGGPETIYLRRRFFHENRNVGAPISALNRPDTFRRFIIVHLLILTRLHYLEGPSVIRGTLICFLVWIFPDYVIRFIIM